MKGMLYGVGVGPGDPKLLTLLAVELLEGCDLLALPVAGESVAYQIALAAVPSLAEKEQLALALPMTRDEAELRRAREAAADCICQALDAGKQVVFPTLGDSTIYSTYGYLHELVTARGYRARFVPGVPSFCGAAAAAGVTLARAEEPIHILPASYPGWAEGLALPGTKVLMKSGKQLVNVKETLLREGQYRDVTVVERCGMVGERIWRDLSDLPEDASYFSLAILRDEHRDDEEE